MADNFPFPVHPEILPEWEAAARRFLQFGGACLVLGAPDTGKSTLSRYLVQQVHTAGQPAGLVDLDLGQSHLGPPASLGLGLFPPLTPGDDSLSPQGLYFIGQTSPLGAVLEVTVGCRVLADQAAALGINHLVVNTSGFVQGPGALRLKKAQAELLQPALILALQREQELEPLLRGLGGITEPLKAPPPLVGGGWGEGERRDFASPTPALPHRGGGRNLSENSPWQILRLPVSSRVSRRDPDTRRLYREARFRRYFHQASTISFPWSSFTWEGLPLGRGRPLPPWRLRQLGQHLGVKALYAEAQGRRLVLLSEQPPPDAAAAESVGRPDWGHLHWLSWEGLQLRLVGLLDGRQRTLALGLIRPSPWDPEALAVVTPLAPAAATRVRLVKLGKLRLNLEGQELPHV